MDLFGIGPLELAFIIIIILLVLGPKEMVNALRTLGKFLRSIVTSDWWQTTSKAIQDVRKLPYDLMREAGMDEDLNALDEIRRTASGKETSSTKKTTQNEEKEIYSAWTTPSEAEDSPPADTIPDSNQDEQSSVDPKILPPDIPAGEAGEPKDSTESGES